MEEFKWLAVLGLFISITMMTYLSLVDNDNSNKDRLEKW
jgi:hypothetical protein